MKFPKAYTEDKKCVNVVIETPYKSRNKFAYDKDTGMFKLSKVIPTGMEFPCDMGFIPHTEGEDGDPLDVLILMDELTYPGCLVECKIIGVIKATQTKKGETTERNDRFVAVPANMQEYNYLKHIKDLNKSKLQSIICFFENYNKREDKEFKLLDILDAKKAHGILKKYKK